MCGFGLFCIEAHFRLNLSLERMCKCKPEWPSVPEIWSICSQIPFYFFCVPLGKLNQNHQKHILISYITKWLQKVFVCNINKIPQTCNHYQIIILHSHTACSKLEAINTIKVWDFNRSDKTLMHMKLRFCDYPSTCHRLPTPVYD